MGSREESCDGADACALGLQKGAFIIDSDQLLSDPASRKILQPNPADFRRRWRQNRGNRETAGRVVVEKEIVKEVLAELLNEIPAFKALVSGEGARPTRQSGEGPSSADEGTSREADSRGKASW